MVYGAGWFWHGLLQTDRNRLGVVPSAQAASVPCVPGSEGLISSDQEALDVVAKIGLPVMIKATAGAWELVRLRACRDGELLQIIHSAC